MSIKPFVCILYFSLFFDFATGQSLFNICDPTIDIKDTSNVITLKWKKTKSKYDIYFYKDSIFKPLQIGYEDTFLIVKDLNWWKTYKWYVIARSDSDSISSNIQTFNLPQTIHINNKEECKIYRSLLISGIWGDIGFPVKDKPDEIFENYFDPTYSYLNNIEKIDRYRIVMDSGFVSYVYHFYPKKSRNKFFFLQTGHSNYAFEANVNILFEELINLGYHVILFWMPNMGYNYSPNLNKGNVLYSFSKHNDFIAIDSDTLFSSGTALKLFFEPIAITANFLSKKFNINEFDMGGLSGGGWTTTVYAAIDNRIKRSFNIAGNTPAFLWNLNNGGGDYEQDHKLFKENLNYLDLYLLSSDNYDRNHYQIFNVNDFCCFFGNGYMFYKDEIKKRIENFGSKFEILPLFHNYGHIIADSAVNFITNKLELNPFSISSVISDTSLLINWKNNFDKCKIIIANDPYLDFPVYKGYSVDTCLNYIYNSGARNLYFSIQFFSGDSIIYSSPIYRQKLYSDVSEFNSLLLNINFDGKIEDQSINQFPLVANIILSSDRNDTIAKAAKFNGINNFIDITDNKINEALSSDFSISFWIRYKDLYTNYSLILGNNDPVYPYPGLNVFVNTPSKGKIYFRLDANNGVYSNQSNLNDNIWHHCVFIKLKDSLFIYIDGKKDASIKIQVNSNVNYNIFRVGANNQNYTIQCYKGDLDEIRIYKKALDANEINCLFNDKVFSFIDTNLFNIDNYLLFRWKIFYDKQVNYEVLGSNSRKFNEFKIIFKTIKNGFDLFLDSAEIIYPFYKIKAITTDSVYYSEVLCTNFLEILKYYFKDSIIGDETKVIRFHNFHYEHQFCDSFYSNNTQIYRPIVNTTINLDWIKIYDDSIVISPNQEELNRYLYQEKKSYLSFFIEDSILKMRDSIQLLIHSKNSWNNHKPYFTSIPKNLVDYGTNYYYKIHFNDDDLSKGDSLKLFINLPKWMNFNASDTSLNGLVDNQALQDSVIKISVFDSFGDSCIQKFSVSVRLVYPNTPIINYVNPPIIVNEEFSYPIITTKDSSLLGRLEYITIIKPDWIHIDSSSGDLYGNVTNFNSNDSVIQIIVKSNYHEELLTYKFRYVEQHVLNVNKLSEKKIDVYPNPINDYINIIFKNEKCYDSKIFIALYDLSGKCVASFNEDCDEGVVRIRRNLSFLSNGTYILAISSGKLGVKTLKIMKL